MLITLILQLLQMRCQVGSMVLMLATQYNANVKIVTRNIIVSTLLSVITIPIVVATMLL